MEYIFDTHAHYDDEAFDEDRESLIGSLRENGIGNVCNIGASMESCRTTLAMAEKYPFFYGALGVHPNETKAPEGLRIGKDRGHRRDRPGLLLG